MSATPRERQSAKPAYGTHTTRGEWRPSEPLAPAPIFVWPPRPKQFLNWLLAFSGFLWPFDAVYFLITVITWLYLQPELSRTAEFRFDWIAQKHLRNLALLWLTAGGWHALLFTFKWQGTERKYNLAPSSTICTIAISSATTARTRSPWTSGLGRFMMDRSREIRRCRNENDRDWVHK